MTATEGIRVYKSLKDIPSGNTNIQQRAETVTRGAPHLHSLTGIGDSPVTKESFQQDIYILRGSMAINFSARLNQAFYVLEKKKKLMFFHGN